MGALARSVARADLGVHDGGFRRDALSYHQDGDRLGELERLDRARRAPMS